MRIRCTWPGSGNKDIELTDQDVIDAAKILGWQETVPDPAYNTQFQAIEETINNSTPGSPEYNDAQQQLNDLVDAGPTIIQNPVKAETVMYEHYVWYISDTLVDDRQMETDAQTQLGNDKAQAKSDARARIEVPEEPGPPA